MEKTVFVQLKKEFLGKQPGEKVDLAENDAQTLITQGVAVLLPTEDPANQLVTKAVNDAATQLESRISTIINESLKQFMTAQSGARKHAIPAIFGTDGASLGDTNPKKCFGDWLVHVAKNDEAYLEKVYGSYRGKAALAETSGTTGGYVVPPEFANALAALVAEEAIVRSRAFIQPMASATLMFPYLDVTTALSAGQSAYFGGVVMNWTEEAQTRTETEPLFKQMELKAHELSGYAVSSNVLLQDAAFGLERFLYSLFSRAIAWYEDYAFFQGNGVGKPIGILNAPAVISVTRNTANDVKLVDIATMVSKLLPGSSKSAFWCVHPYTLKSLTQLADAAGRVVWISNQGGAQEYVPGVLFGRPVLVTEKLPGLGTKGDVMLIDFGLYVIGDRMQTEIAASEHVNFLKNQMTWRVVERVDGQPWIEKAITLADGTNTVSPFIALN